MISAKVTIHRLATGVPGLDDVLGGGLPEFSFNLIAGPPGCGKTTLAHQIMFALATPEQPALYFTMLGEPPLKMLRYQQQFDFFDLDKLNRSIRFVNLSDEFKAGDLEKVLQRIVGEVEARAPGLVFIESFSTMAMQGQSRAPASNRPAAVHSRPGRAADELAGHDLPDRRILQRDRPEPGVHRLRRTDLAAARASSAIRWCARWKS